MTDFQKPDGNMIFMMYLLSVLCYLFTVFLPLPPVP